MIARLMVNGRSTGGTSVGLRRRRWLGPLVALIALRAHAAQADDAPAPLPDPDTQAARRHYERGIALYDQQHYAEASGEFEEARRIKTLPAFDYNIGRCDERMEKWGLAADAYDRYLAAEPNAPEAPELRSRIVVLRGRSGAVVPPKVDTASPAATPMSAVAAKAPARSSSALTTVPVPPSTPNRKWWIIGAVAAVVVIGAAVGIGVAASGGSQAPVPTSTDGTFTVRY